MPRVRPEDRTIMSAGRSDRVQDAEDRTADIPRRAFPIQASKLPVFSPAGDRTLEGLKRFLASCTTDRADFQPMPSAVAANATRAEVLQVGDPDRLVMELVVVHDSPREFLAIYRAPPPDLMTRLPELQLVDLKRRQARLIGPLTGEFMVSALTVDNVSHLIILSQVRRSNSPQDQSAGEDIEIEIEFDDDAT